MTNLERRYFTISNSGTYKNVTPDFANGCYSFEWPSEFYNSKFPKQVRIISFTYFKLSADSNNIDVGKTLHSDFNQETNELDRFIALSSYGSVNEKIFTISQPQKINRIWFRDFDGSLIFPATEAHYFFIQMELFY